MRRTFVSRRRSRGLNLVELLVAISLSVLLLAGVGTIFASSRSTYATNEALARIEENGRFALDAIAQDVRGAGYVGCNKNAVKHNVLNGGNTAGSLWNFGEGVRAFDAQSGAAWIPTLDTAHAPEPVSGSDALILHVPRPANPKLQLTAPMTSPTDVINVRTYPSGHQGVFHDNQILMISNCESSTVFEVTNYDPQAGTIEHAETSGTETSPGNSSDSLEWPYDANSSVIAVQSVVYYVRLFDGVPTLYRRIDNAAPQPLAENVEMMQLRVGYDSNADRIADDNVIPSAATTHDRVVSVTVALLVRGPEPYGEAASRTYTVLDTPVTYDDQYMRKVFTTTALVRNTAR